MSTQGGFTLSGGLINDPLAISTRGYFAFIAAVALSVAIAPDFFLVQPRQTLYLLTSDIDQRAVKIISLNPPIRILEVE